MPVPQSSSVHSFHVWEGSSRAPPSAVAASLVASLTLASRGTSPSATACRVSPSPPLLFIAPSFHATLSLVVVFAMGHFPATFSGRFVRRALPFGVSVWTGGLPSSGVSTAVESPWTRPKGHDVGLRIGKPCFPQSPRRLRFCIDESPASPVRGFLPMGIVLMVLSLGPTSIWGTYMFLIGLKPPPRH